MTINKFATNQILKKPVEVVKERILAAQKSPEPCCTEMGWPIKAAKTGFGHLPYEYSI